MCWCCIQKAHTPFGLGWKYKPIAMGCGDSLSTVNVLAAGRGSGELRGPGIQPGSEPESSPRTVHSHSQCPVAHTGHMVVLACCPASVCAHRLYPFRPVNPGNPLLFGTLSTLQQTPACKQLMGAVRWVRVCRVSGSAPKLKAPALVAVREGSCAILPKFPSFLPWGFDPIR